MNGKVKCDVASCDHLDQVTGFCTYFVSTTEQDNVNTEGIDCLGYIDKEVN